MSLKGLLGKIGSTVIGTSMTFPIDMFLLMGEDYTADGKLGRQCHGKRKMFELNLNRAGFKELRRSLYACLAEANIGREIVLYGVKL